MLFKDKLLGALYKQYQTDKWLQELFTAIGLQLDVMQEALSEIPNQILIDSATYGLEILENALGIGNVDKTIDERRAIVEAKLKADGKCDVALLQAVVDSWKNGVAEIGFQQGKLVVTFVGEYGVPDDMESLKAAMYESKPAHLPIEYIFSYLLIRDVSNMTLTQLESSEINKFAF